MVVIAFVASVCSMLCFSFQRGYNSMKAFLRYYVVQHPDKVQRGADSGLETPSTSETAKSSLRMDSSSRAQEPEGTVE